MVTFLGAFVAFTAGLLVLAMPVLVVARRIGRENVVRRFLWGAGLVGAFCGLISASSVHLVRQCEEAGNLNCIDYGATGLQLVFVGVYTLAAWVSAFLLKRD